MTPVISLRGVTFGHGAAIVLEDISLDLAPGEVLALLGPSGSGKSSLLRLILGFVAPRRGELLLRGRLASTAQRVLIPPEQRNLAVVFQDLALWPHLTVQGNLAFGLGAKRVRRAEQQRRITRALQRVELDGMQQRYPGQLSGGEQQRVAIARALVLEPDAVLLDEPLTNLDVGLREDLLDLFAGLFRESGSTVIHVTHDPREALRLGDRVAVMDRGRLLHTGSLEQLDPQHPSKFVQRICRHLKR